MPFTPRIYRLVACPEQWYRYVLRHEQLTRLDFRQLDCDLVGRSYLRAVVANVVSILIGYTASAGGGAIVSCSTEEYSYLFFVLQLMHL